MIKYKTSWPHLLCQIAGMAILIIALTLKLKSDISAVTVIINIIIYGLIIYGIMDYSVMEIDGATITLKKLFRRSKKIKFAMVVNIIVDKKRVEILYRDEARQLEHIAQKGFSFHSKVYMAEMKKHLEELKLLNRV